MKTRILIGASVVLAAVVAVVLVARSSQTPEVPRSGPTSVPTASVPLLSVVKKALGTERHGCAMKVGDTLAYSLEVKNRLELSADLAQAAQTATRDVTTTVSTFVQFEVLQARSSSWVLLGRFADLAAPSSFHPEELNTPFLIEVDDACQVVQFARANDAVLLGARNQQGLLWELTWRWATEAQTVNLENVRGPYTASVATAEVNQQRVAQRRVQQYTGMWDHTTHVTAEGLATVTPGETAWFESLVSTETLHSPAVTSQLEVRASLQKSRPEVVAGVDHSVPHYTWQNLLPMQLERREARPVTQQERQMRELVKDQTPAQAITTLQKQIDQGTGIAAAWPPLMAYLEARPEQTQAVVNELKTRDLAPEVVNPIYIALGNARTVEAREALLAIKRDTLAPPSERARAMFSLVDRPDIGAPFARELHEDSMALTGTPTAAERFVANESLLALTTMAGLHPEPDVRRIAQDTVEPLLSSSGTPRTIGTALRALANLGDPALLPQAAPYTQHPDVDVRKAATRVIRRLNPKDSKAFVTEWLAREKNLWVKRELFSTLELQHFDAKAKVDPELTQQLMVELQTGEHAAIARKTLVRLISMSEMSSTPEVRALLKAQAKKEFPLRNGMFEEVLKHLTPEEIREVAP